nr:DUF5987 family protein [Amycolatopsis rubida]
MRTATLEAFAGTIVPGEKRAPDDRAIAGVSDGPGAVVAGAVELVETPATGITAGLDAVGARRAPTDRIEHLVGLAVRDVDVGSEARWTYGPADAEQRVTGPVVDFCLVATRRRHRDDLGLRVAGTDADRWLDVAGRRPGQFRLVEAD